MVPLVEHKLKAYSWNLIEGYEGNLVFRVTETDFGGNLIAAAFASRNRFKRFEVQAGQSERDLLLREPSDSLGQP
jgi:ribonuclease Z